MGCMLVLEAERNMTVAQVKKTEADTLAALMRSCVVPVTVPGTPTRLHVVQANDIHLGQGPLEAARGRVVQVGFLGALVSVA